MIKGTGRLREAEMNVTHIEEVNKSSHHQLQCRILNPDNKVSQGHDTGTEAEPGTQEINKKKQQQQQQKR